MPVRRTSTLAHYSPPKTVRSTPPPTDDCRQCRRRSNDAESISFWDPVKMSRLNASLVRQKYVSTERATSSAGDSATFDSDRANSYEADLATPTAAQRQMPDVTTSRGRTRESRSPSIHITPPVAGPMGETAPLTTATAGLPVWRTNLDLYMMKNSEEVESVPRAGSAGLSMSAHHSVSPGTSHSPSPAAVSLYLIHRPDRYPTVSQVHCGKESRVASSTSRRGSPAKAHASATTPTPASLASPRLSARTTAVACAMVRIPETGRGASTRSAPRTTRTFERTEQPRLGYLQWKPPSQPPTARNRFGGSMAAVVASPRAGATSRPLTASPQRLEAGTLSAAMAARQEPGGTATVPDMGPGVLVHTPRVRVSTTPARSAIRKTKEKKKRTSTKVHDRQPPVKATPSAAPGERVTTVSYASDTDEVLPQPYSHRHDDLRESHSGCGNRRSSVSPAPLQPHTPTLDDAHGGRTSEYVTTSSCVEPGDEPEATEAHAALARRAAALRREVQQLEIMKSELQTTVSQLVHQLDQVSHEVDEAGRAHQSHALVSERLIRSVAADWALQQNAMIERLAMLEEENLGL